MTTDKQIAKACKAAKKLKRPKQVGSYAWLVSKKFHVQSDAVLYEDGMHYTFATCDCGEDFDENTTVCAHVIRVLIEIRSQYE